MPLFWILTLGCALFSCVEPQDYPIEPELEYIGFSKLTIPQGGPNAPSDTLVLRLGFTDGDGDLGSNDSTIDIFLTDSRDSSLQIRKLPVIPEEGVSNGISGEITLRFPNQPTQICCLYPDPSQESCNPSLEFPRDSFFFEVQIRDQAGNFSNIVRTETVTILCD